MHESVTEDSIGKANGQFWEQMLGMTLVPVSATGERCVGAAHVMGSCDLKGAWEGRIEVRLSYQLALEATAAMMGQARDSVQPEDMLDATKEIANMIAGTIKSALPRPCTMSVPMAEAEGKDFCTLPRTEDSVSVFFAHTCGELTVRVLEAATAAVNAPAEVRAATAQHKRESSSENSYKPGPESGHEDRYAPNLQLSFA